MADFGLILPIQRRDAGLDVLLHELGEEVVAAERAGFDAVFLTEFHQARGGALVSPLLVLAWLGANTTRIKLGTLVLAGPLHDPVRLAEDVLMLDWATRRRVILGLGTAHMRPDFALYGRPRAWTRSCRARTSRSNGSRRGASSTATGRRCETRPRSGSRGPRRTISQVRMRHPTGPSHDEAITAIERFGREVVAPLGETAAASR